MTSGNNPINPNFSSHSSSSRSSSSSSSQSSAIPSSLSSIPDQTKPETLVHMPLQPLKMSSSERFASYRPFFYSVSGLLTSLGVGSAFFPKSESSSTIKYAGVALLFLGCGFACSAYFTRTSEENWKIQARALINQLMTQDNPQVVKQELKQFIMRSVGCNGSHEATMSQVIRLLGKICQEEQLKIERGGNPIPQGLQNLQIILKENNLFAAIELKKGKAVESPIRHVDEIIDDKFAINRENKEARKMTTVSNLNIDDLRKERMWRLKHKEEVYDRVIQDPLQQTAIKFFPFTRAWYIGGVQGNLISFECTLAEVGEKHGIIVISDSKHPHFLNYSNTLELVQERQRTFPQDFLDFNSQEICFPAVIDSNPEFTTSTLKDAMYDARRERFLPYRALDRDDPIWAIVRGQPFMTQSYRTSLDLAKALDAQASINLTYSEGGNMLLGINDNKAYAIIGLDSFSASKALMENNLKRKVDDLEVQIAFGIDYGIEKENLFFIEQPGDFHLDMNMAILGPKTIVVNDSEMAYNFLKDHLGPENLNSLLSSLSINQDNCPIDQILDTTKERSLRKKVFEDEAARQLQEKGFEVIRYPGRFEVYFPNILDPEPLMNFFNMVTAKSPEGKNLIISMGCPDKNCGHDFELLFKDMLRIGGLDPDQIDINFLNFNDSRRSLKDNGGISCRVKTVASIPPETVID